jgi:excisionase family DNA binding protein
MKKTSTRRKPSTPAATVGIREAADMLGVSVDTVRNYVRQRRLKFERTAGGHYRFRTEWLAKFQENAAADNAERFPGDESDEPDDIGSEFRADEVDDGDDGPRLPPRRRGRVPSAPAPRQVPEWRSRVRNAKADIHVARAERELRRMEEEDAEREAEKRRRAEERAAAQTRAAEKATRDETERARLATIKAKGKLHAQMQLAPAPQLARVVRDLEAYVTTSRFPASLSEWETTQIVDARVDRALKPWQDAEQRREDEAERVQKEATEARWLQTLIAHGKQRTRSLTLSWDADDKAEMIEDVATALEEDVEPDWTYSQVNDLVDDLVAGADSDDDEDGEDLEDGEDDEDGDDLEDGDDYDDDEEDEDLDDDEEILDEEE